MLGTVPVNAALLKATGVGKVVQAVAKNRSGVFGEEVTKSAEQLKAHWTDLVTKVCMHSC